MVYQECLIERKAQNDSLFQKHLSKELIRIHSRYTKTKKELQNMAQQLDSSLEQDKKESLS